MSATLRHNSFGVELATGISSEWLVGPPIHQNGTSGESASFTSATGVRHPNGRLRVSHKGSFVTPLTPPPPPC